ncbi:MAG TPA: FixH family protein [Polyangiaceae bacterium]|nr:FixH family protein [Polyangiaceae bacterium]
MSLLSKALLLASTALVLACSSSPPDGINQDELTSESGSLLVTVSSAPDALPVRGENQIFYLVKSSATGAPVDGLALSMTPIMPAHSHASPDVPAGVGLGGGSYRFDDVLLSMPGLWELRTTVAGSPEDHFTPRFEVE